ncbi:hypothetical protein [Streptomyces sp. NPDC004065]|uniref:hypothetical protein n=1 Tax=Streptomyces sp. NPDC004065 TaxID=3364689 RepID=UPI00384E9806
MTTDRPRAVGATSDPAWWTKDEERWELLRFEAAHDETGLPLDRWWKDRQDVLEAFALTAAPVDHCFARFLLEQETLFHRHCWGFSHSIEIAALLLAEHRRPEDVWHLWEAICTSFDTWCGLPHQLLFAAGGKQRTISYVTNCDHEQRDNLLEHLHELDTATDDQVTALIAERRQYYTDALADIADTPDRDDNR